MSELHDDLLQHRAWLLSFLEIPRGGVVLDLGCGRGEDLRALAMGAPDRPALLVGLDAHAPSVAAAQALSGADPRLRFQRHDLEGPLPFEEDSVDAVYSSNLLECLPDPDALVREVARVLRPGGRLVVGHWDWDSQAFDGRDKALVRRLVHAFADWQQAWMGHSDGWMGRRLWGVFNGGGLFTGSAQARVLINTRYAAPWFGFANTQAFRSLSARGLASAEDVGRFEAEQAALDQAGRYFYSVTGYAYVGRRTSAA